MTWVEASGKTLEEAREAAARELGVLADQIEYEVLEQPGKGFLGMGQAKIRIRASAAGREVTDAGEAVEEEEMADATPAPEGETEAPLEMPGPSKGARAVTMLESIFEEMQFEARPVLVEESPEEIQIDVVGAEDDLGRLIGRQGHTLDALQYLVGIAVNRSDPQKARIVLDAEGYRERHRQMLEARARDYAARVRETGKEAVLEPQSPRDRRIMHMALADDPYVYTYSEGEGEDRHVVISPRK